MEIKWLRNGLRNLENVENYISQNNPEAATQVIVKIRSSVNQLAAYPYMGREGRVEGTRELVISQTPYIVVYRVRQETVEILRVLHSASRWPKKF
ncbi:MAG: type II toxin-antitoxin system RelE/ParE family toxin [Okeania sp. SIO2H7]|nr:type II toxin-antitoxin system RelE/ParE family toxin [Okeania sp. SIO2H7]